MLSMRPNCECCDGDLPAESPGAMICSFECTFCVACAGDRFGGVCPNCSGALAPRPARAAVLLVRFPASPTRVVKPHAPCTA